jgi:hypothetical protein
MSNLELGILIIPGFCTKMVYQCVVMAKLYEWTSCPRRGSNPGRLPSQSGICKTNTIPILLHPMRISTNQVSSVVLRPKKLEIRKIVKTVKEPKTPNTVPWNWAKSVEVYNSLKLLMIIYPYLCKIDTIENWSLKTLQLEEVGNFFVKKISETYHMFSSDFTLFYYVIWIFEEASSCQILLSK